MFYDTVFHSLSLDYFDAPVVWLSCQNNVTGRADIEEQTFYSLYEMASNMNRELVNKVFSFHTFSSDMNSKLNKDLRRFIPLYGMQGIHLSSKNFVLAKRNSVFENGSDNVENFLHGVFFVHSKVNMNKLFKMYNYDEVKAKGETLLELLNHLHDIGPTQLQSIHKLTAEDIAKLNETTLRDLEDIGVIVDDNTMDMMIKIAIRLGTCLYHPIMIVF